MPYKNTAGNSSIANEWGQWRYFNSAFDKLGTAKPASISLNHKNVATPEEDDWTGAFASVATGATKILEAYETKAGAVAEEYLKTHSLEEYQQQIQAGAVPFQDDPLAMAKLKEAHGSMVFQYAKEDFKSLVDANKFAGKTPQEVDAEFFKYLKENTQGIAASFGYSDNDYFFNKGLFRDSPAERTKMMLQQKLVENDWKKREAMTTGIAKDTAVILNGANSETVFGLMENFSDTWGGHFNPEEKFKAVTSYMQSVINTNNGAETLQYLADKPLKLLNGATLREVMGDEGLKTLVIKARDFRHNNDVKAKYDWENGIDLLVNAGSYTVIKARRDEELRSNGNIKTERVEYLEKAYDKAVAKSRELLAKEQTKSEKAREELDKTTRAAKWIMEGSFGNNLVDPAVADFNSTHIKKAYQELMDEGRLSIEQQLVLANNASISDNNNPARAKLKSIKNKAISDLKGNVTAYAEKSSTHFEPSEELTQVAQLLNEYPELARGALGIYSDTDAELLLGVASALNGGRPYDDIVRSMAGVEQLKSTSSGRAKLSEINTLTNNSVRTSLISAEKKNLDGASKQYIRRMAGNYTALGYSPAEATAKAMEDFETSYTVFLGTGVPKTFFTEGYADGVERAKEKIQQDLKGVDLANVDVAYEPSSNTLIVSTLGGEVLNMYTQSDFNEFALKRHKEMIEEQNARATPMNRYKEARENQLLYGVDY